MLLIIPFLQIILFGYAINTNPKFLPTSVIDYDRSEFSRKLIQGLINSEYFSIHTLNPTEKQAERLMREGKTLITIHINSDFSKKLIRGEVPEVLMEADFTDFFAVGGAISTAETVVNQLYSKEKKGLFHYFNSGLPTVVLNVHRLYNPTLNTTYNMIPGLIGVIIFLTLAILASHTITDEKTQGTFLTLINSPIKSYELILGKIIPYILIGYVQLTIVILFAWWLFDLPIHGSLALFYLVSFPFIVASLVYGIYCSIIASSSMLSQQFVILIYLPSIFLSGFMFPFYGLPKFAQYIGELLPLTHYIRISRGIFIKGYNLEEVWVHLWPILIFLLIFSILSVITFKKTLD